jgi:putative oxidoreductase
VDPAPIHYACRGSPNAGLETSHGVPSRLVYLLHPACDMSSSFNTRDTARSNAPLVDRGILERYTTFAPQFLSMLRIIAAFMFVLAGTSKLFAFPVPMPQGGTVPLLSELGIGGLLETFGGALLLIGLFTRPVAFVLSGEMAVAYLQFHFPNSFWPTVNQGVPAVLYCFLFLYLSAAGAGPWSVDALRSSKRR